MAITHDYVSWSTGNDYKGASFTDGAFTVADMTLTKAGAFAASKANHWLYLTDNGSNNVTDGYYRISSVTSANAVVLATSPKSGATDPTDVVCTQHAGTTALPWRSDQGAVDLCTRNTTDGNQVNVLAGSAVVHAAALDMATFVGGGALSATAPLILRGYTSAANDGGIGEIDCGGVTMFADVTIDWIVLADLEIHTFGDNHGISIDDDNFLFHCTIHKGASSPSGKRLISLDDRNRIIGCYVYDAGAGAAIGIYCDGYSLAVGNYVAIGSGAGSSSRGIQVGSQSSVIENIVKSDATGTTSIYAVDAFVSHNITFNSTASTVVGIVGTSITTYFNALNNIVVGQSGAGGAGIGNTANVMYVGYNAFYNCTSNYTIGDQTFIDLTTNDVALAADPFTDAANGDFSLTAAAKTALADKGFPSQYLGAHANTDSHLNIGPIQMAAGGGSSIFRRVARLVGG